MTVGEKIMEAGRRTLRVLGWTPSRYAKWKECPQKVLLEDLLKMCPMCFRGRVSGGYDGEAVVCDTCVKDQPERAALDRGNRLDAALTNSLTGAAQGVSKEGATEEEILASIEQHEVSVAEATRHPKIRALAQKLKRTKGVLYQESIVLDRTWSRVGQFTENAWARLKLDVLVLRPKKIEIIDWKSGNIDKRTQEIRERHEYKDSMLAYQIAGLSAYPQAEASATMAFLDAPPKLDNPFKELVVLKRKDLAVKQREWEEKVKPMLADVIFAPRPGYYCGWCPFQKAKGGPCRF